MTGSYRANKAFSDWFEKWKTVLIPIESLLLCFKSYVDFVSAGYWGLLIIIYFFSSRNNLPGMPNLFPLPVFCLKMSTSLLNSTQTSNASLFPFFTFVKEYNVYLNHKGLYSLMFSVNLCKRGHGITKEIEIPSKPVISMEPAVYHLANKGNLRL